MAIFSLDWWWLLCQTDLEEDGVTKTRHRPLVNINALLVNTEMCKETGRDVFLQKKKCVLFQADCANLPIILLQIRVWLGRMWRGWLRNLSLIPLPGLMYLSDEPIMSIYWYSYHEQSYIVVFLY